MTSFRKKKQKKKNVSMVVTESASDFIVGYATFLQTVPKKGNMK